MIYAILVVVGIITGITAGMFGFSGGFVIVPLVYHFFPAYDRWLPRPRLPAAGRCRHLDCGHDRGTTTPR